MALAAETLAAAVASLLRMTPTKTLSADLVWLRASERISVSDLVIARLYRFRPEVFTGRGIGIVHDEIVTACHRAERDGGKIRLLTVAPRAADELNDLCAHENPSHTAIATRPANASDIR
jgi:hypothetical protein